MSTLSDIARRLGISPATVSRALNPARAHLISEPLRLRIRAVAEKLRYASHGAALHRAQSAERTLGIVVATPLGSLFFSDYLAKLLAGIDAALAGRPGVGVRLVILRQEASMTEIDPLLLGGQIDGLLLSSICDVKAHPLTELADYLDRRWHRPIVALNLAAQSPSRIHHIGFDQRAAAGKAMRYLLRKGHRRIGLVYADTGSLDWRERRGAYRDALRRHGVAEKPEWMVDGEASVEGGQKAVLSLLLRKKDRPTALFCLNDEMAIGALKALRERGVRCPQEMAVMGFDGLDVGAHLSPALTSVAQPTFEIARQGTLHLLSRLKGAPASPRAHNVPAALIQRDSA